MVKTGHVPEAEENFSKSSSSSWSSSWTTSSAEVRQHNAIRQASFYVRPSSWSSRELRILDPQEPVIIENGKAHVVRDNPVEDTVQVFPSGSSTGSLHQVEERDPDLISVNSSASIQMEGRRSITLPESPTASEHSGGQNDYLAVRRVDNVLYLNTDRPIQAEYGCVTTRAKDGTFCKVAVTAILDDDLEDNVVSHGFAIQNGLEIESLEEGEGVWVELDDHAQTRSTEQAVLEWSKESSHRKPFRVRCWVIEYSGRPIHFGRPFIEKREHYWGSSCREPLR